MIRGSIDNTDLLKLPQTAFLYKRKVTVSMVMRCFGEALAQRKSKK